MGLSEYRAEVAKGTKVYGTLYSVTKLEARQSAAVARVTGLDRLMLLAHPAVLRGLIHQLRAEGKV